MAWIYLFVAVIFEVGWPLGIKLSQDTNYRATWMAAAILSMALSVFFLWLAQKQLPIGTAYAVWTGLGAAGVFIVGIILFDEPADLLRLASVTLILMGVIGLKLANG
jgi:quaternary ammonium compound-resistance protein SugE